MSSRVQSSQIENMLRFGICNFHVAQTIRRNLEDRHRSDLGEGPAWPEDEWTSVDDDSTDTASSDEEGKGDGDVRAEDAGNGDAGNGDARNGDAPPQEAPSQVVPSQAVPSQEARRRRRAGYVYYPASSHFEYHHHGSATYRQGSDAMPILPDGNGLPDSFFTATLDGRGFTPHLKCTFVGRLPDLPNPAVDPNGWAVPAIEGPRVYLVGPRVFVVDRETPGTRKEGVDLLRCEQSVESSCPVFAYKFSGVIFTYGTHNHV